MNFHTTSFKTKTIGLYAAFLAWLADAAYALLHKANSAESDARDAEAAAVVADFDRAIQKGENFEAVLNSTIDKLTADQGEAQAEIDWLKAQRASFLAG